eukprot:m.24717 g.24717  ORF g.24717 m.24717 type:complete len:308 (+) comp13438_c0_seq1:658-1581(+)
MRLKATVLSSSSSSSSLLVRFFDCVMSDLTTAPSTNSSLRGWSPRVHQTCPTCHGKGKIVQDALKEEELIALIPYKDKRLKPRRTKLIIAGTVIMTAAALLLVVFFLFPRSVPTKLTAGIAQNVNVTCDKYSPTEVDTVHMTILWSLQVKNSNYLPITVKDGLVQVYSPHSIYSGNVTMSSFSVAARSAKTQHISVPVMLAGRDASNVWKNSCVRGTTLPYNTFVLEFRMKAAYQVMSFESGMDMDMLVHVTCPIKQSPINPPIAPTINPNSTTFPPNATLVPPTATETTTATLFFDRDQELPCAKK